MVIRHNIPSLLAALVVLSSAGCQKTVSNDPVAPPVVSTREVDTLAHVHWVGKKRLTTDTNAASFISIWNWPESAKLETQTLDMLSTAPWRLLRGETNAANPASKLLRPLLDDLVQEESYVEVRQATNQPAETVLAIRLNDAQGGLWSTNLASVLESLTALRPTSSANGRPGWSLKKHHAPNLIELARVGEWTVVGAAQGANPLFGDMLRRIERDHTPFPSAAANHWLEADFDLAGAIKMLSGDWKPPQNSPRISVKVTGNGQSVSTKGTLDFPKPLPFEFEPWNIPTNFIGEPLMGFTAIQGIRPWLSALESSYRFQAGPPPNQIFSWSLLGIPARTYFAAPLANASNQVHQLISRLMEILNPPLAARNNGAIEWSGNPSSARLDGLGWMVPFLQATQTISGEFAFGGTQPDSTASDSPPQELLQAVLGRTNLVYYDWEMTGPRIIPGLYIGQLLRLVSGKAQIPFTSASIAWLQAAESKLGNCTTVVTKTGPATLSYVRTSAIGFTAIELQLLADWLESPQFPSGLHTFRAPPDVPPGPASPPTAAPAKP